MTSDESLEFPGPPERVWPLFSDLDHVAAWHDSLVTHDAPPASELEPGTRFRVLFRLRGRDRELDARIVALHPPRRIEVEYEGGGLGPGGSALETVSLTSLEGGTTTRVRRVVRIHAPSMPLWARLVSTLLLRFGRSVGPSPLEDARALLDSPPDRAT